MATSRGLRLLRLWVLVGLCLGVGGSVAGSVAPAAAAPQAAVVAFVGATVVDLVWDPVACEYYEVTRDGGPSSCSPAADVDTGKIYCRDAGLTSGASVTYRVEAVTGATPTPLSVSRR